QIAARFERADVEAPAVGGRVAGPRGRHDHGVPRPARIEPGIERRVQPDRSQPIVVTREPDALPADRRARPQSSSGPFGSPPDPPTGIVFPVEGIAALLDRPAGGEANPLRP